MSSTVVHVAYDGPALKGGRMDVHDLAPALLALGDICVAANEALNDVRATVNVSVRADFQPGSFDITFELSQALGIFGKVRDVLAGNTVNAVINASLLAGMIFGPQGVIWLIKHFEGKRPKSKVILEDGRVRIIADGITAEVPEQIYKLYLYIPAREAIERSLEPLKKDGIDKFIIQELPQGQEIEVVTKEEREYFVTPRQSETELPSTEYEAAYSIQTVAFKDDNKWRLSTSEGTITASIEDAGFLARVSAGEPFRKGDILRCRITLRQWSGTKGVRDERIVTRVLEHIRAPEQLMLGDVPADKGETD